MASKPLVSIALPVFNGADTIAAVVQSVMAQDYGDIELVISDNASTDTTEAVCRELAEVDSRIRYHRQSQNIGLLRNFLWAREEARGTYFRWIGDDDEIAPNHVSRCCEVFASDPRLILVTTQLAYTGPDGTGVSARYDCATLSSDDPIDRWEEILKLLSGTYWAPKGSLLIDPIYGMYKRELVRSIPYYYVQHGDELYATKLALVGPWVHIPDVLGHRHVAYQSDTGMAELLGFPRWHARVEHLLECNELLAQLADADLTLSQRRRGSAAVARFYVRRHRHVAAVRSRKIFEKVRQGKRRIRSWAR